MRLLLPISVVWRKFGYFCLFFQSWCLLPMPTEKGIKPSMCLRLKIYNSAHFSLWCSFFLVPLKLQGQDSHHKRAQRHFFFCIFLLIIKFIGVLLVRFLFFFQVGLNLFCLVLNQGYGMSRSAGWKLGGISCVICHLLSLNATCESGNLRTSLSFRHFCNWPKFPLRVSDLHPSHGASGDSYILLSGYL